MSVPFRVKAVFEYTSEHDDDLKFDEGQIITVTEEEDDDWYFGEYTDSSGAKQEGLFPRNYVEKFEPTAPPRPARRAKRDSVDQSISIVQPETAPTAAPEGPVSPVVAPTFTAPPSIPTSAPAPPAPVVVPVAVEAEPEPEQEEIIPVSSPVAKAAELPNIPAPVAIPEPAPEPTPVAAPPVPTPVPAPVPVPVAPANVEVPSQPKPSPPVPVAAPAAPVPKKAPAPASSSSSKPPPPVAGKPSNNAFLQRIAAFNKGGGGPVVPVKPASSNMFIKKPFVAAPPSRDAYVPPTRKDYIPTNIYRREEDPDVKQQEEETREVASKTHALIEQQQGEDGEDQPKPLSLKERMALLQKQQMEAAQRHADLVSKKEKPKKPVKKRTESSGAPFAVDRSAIIDGEGSAKPSLDEARPPIPASPSRQASVRTTAEPVDGNDADVSSAAEGAEGDDEVERKPRPPVVPEEREETQEADEEEEEEEEEEEDEEAAEIRRKEELRARMAKLSGGMGMGGMGMGGMFGGPMMGMGGAPPIRKKKPAAPKERQSMDESREDAPVASAPMIPIPGMMALPGLAQKKRTEETPVEKETEEEPEVASPAVPPVPESPRPARKRDSVSGNSETSRPAPPAIPSSPISAPPVPIESRGAPPLPPVLAPPADIQTPSPGSAADDEATDAPELPSLVPSSPTVRSPPPIPSSPAGNRAPPLPPLAAPSTSDVPEIPSSPQSKRLSRPPPPIPGAVPGLPPVQTRAPPPPPPGGAPSLPAQNYGDDEAEEEEEEEEAITLPHAAPPPIPDGSRRPSIADSTHSVPPPLPSAAAPRAVPPRVPAMPSAPAPAPASYESRRSLDAPRVAPPMPPSASPSDMPYRSQRQSFSYSRQAPAEPMIDEEGVFNPHAPVVSTPPPRNAGIAATPSRSAKQSFDSPRTFRRSIDVSRQSMSVETGFIANDIDLALHVGWYTEDNEVPPVFQGRRDILYESELETSTNGGAKTVITRKIYVLFQDYSQTIITVKYDPYNTGDVTGEQRHEVPPRTPREDQLGDAHERYGKLIAEAASGCKDTVVADGSSQSFVMELLKPFKDLLAPVGSRAYGTQVYSSLGAGAPMVDQIRPGDIISCRSAKFQGKHGPMHAKYSMEVGKNDYHVGVVAEWDGLKKKVRAWEQGRESKKVKMESFKLDDLRSGEVKVFRVMPRTWVGWSSAK